MHIFIVTYLYCCLKNYHYYCITVIHGCMVFHYKYSAYYYKYYMSVTASFCLLTALETTIPDV